jgi:trehalose 6-phosphate phosphatase
VSPGLEARDGAAAELLAPLRSDPGGAAVLTDVDGTLAPIVERPEQAEVPAAAVAALRRLAARYRVVACISGRRAEEARRLVGLDEVSYAGNHGLEFLSPGEREPRLDPSAHDAEARTAAFLEATGRPELAAADLRVEDKGPIKALHWRGAADEALAEQRAREIAERAAAAGLAPRWGRKVLELRPPGAGKDAAVAALLAGDGVRAAVYAGDDRTDLDAFRRLRELRAVGSLETAICVGVASAEGPAEIVEEADLSVAGSEGWLALLDSLAG